MKSILQRFVNSEIGMNVEAPATIEPVILRAVDDAHITVVREKDGNTYHIPYFNIVKVIENEDGVKIGGFFHHTQVFPVVVKVGHVVNYVMT